MAMKDTHEKVRRFMIAFNRIDALYVDSVRTFGVKGNLFVLFYALPTARRIRSGRYAMTGNFRALRLTPLSANA